MGSNCAQLMSGIGMTRTGVQRRERDRESLAEILAGRCGNKWRRKQRRSRARVSGSIGRVGAHHADRESFDRGVKHPIAGPDAGLAGAAQEFREQAVAGSAGRIGQADARSKVAISRRSQRARHSGIGGIKNAGGSAGKNDRLLARHECRNLVVLLIPRLDPVPSQTVIQRKAARQPPAILRIEARCIYCGRRKAEAGSGCIGSEFPSRKSAKSDPVSVPKNRKLPLNWAIALTLT